MAELKESCEQLLKQAVLDDPEAQFRLGVQLFLSDASGRSLAQAIHWFNRARENGHPAARMIVDEMEGVVKRCLSGAAEGRAV